MKRFQVNHGRDTVQINHMSVTVNGDDIEAHNIAPFLVRAKWSYEPAIRGGGWDEPDSPEWFAFDGLYIYDADAVFVTEDGVIVKIPQHVELTNVLNEGQLSLIECELRAGWVRDAEDAEEDSHRDLMDALINNDSICW